MWTPGWLGELVKLFSYKARGIMILTFDCASLIIMHIWWRSPSFFAQTFHATIVFHEQLNCCGAHTFKVTLQVRSERPARSCQRYVSDQRTTLDNIISWSLHWKTTRRTKPSETRKKRKNNFRCTVQMKLRKCNAMTKKKNRKKMLEKAGS